MIFSTESDVWSYGILLWEMFSLGLMPYPGIEPSPKFIDSIYRGERMERPEHAPPDVYNIMLGCWRVEPSERLPFERICQLWQRRLRDSSSFSDVSPAAVSNAVYLNGLTLDPQQQPGMSCLFDEEGARKELDSEGYLISLKSPTNSSPLPQTNPFLDGGCLISLKTPTK